MSRAQWNVDKYRTEFECDEHWELRRKFLIAHHDKFPEDELVCLAQTFTNIEFLGCRYPQKTMEKVAFLARGIVDEYREKQKGRLQRTFVAASDAAGAKVKGLKRPQTDVTPSPVPEKQSRLSEEQRSPVVVNLTDNSPVKPRLIYGITIHSLISQKTPSPSSRYGGVHTYHITKEPVKQKLELTENQYGKLLIIETEKMDPTNVIRRSMDTCNVSHSFQTEMMPGDMVKVKLIVNNILVSEYEDSSEKAAREGAARMGILKLKESCYTILVKQKFVSDRTVDKFFGPGPGKRWCSVKKTFVSDTAVDKSVSPGPGNKWSTVMADTETPPGDDNVGNKLLRMMGWSGRGLGRNAQGIAEPIDVQQETVRRAGFGSGWGAGNLTMPQFRQKAIALLQDYANQDTDHDLVFTNEFSPEERKLLHLLGHKMQLKAKTFGKCEEDRFVVVSKKIPIWDEAKRLLAAGGTSEKYELTPPHVTL